MKACVITPDTYGLKKNHHKEEVSEDSVSKIKACVYKGWIPKAYYKMTIPGIEHLQAKTRQKITSIPTTPPISGAIPLLWVADSDGMVLGVDRSDDRPDTFLALIRSPAEGLFVQHWEDKAKRNSLLLSGHDDSYIPLTFLCISTMYFILDAQGCIHIYSKSGRYIRSFSSVTNPIVGITRADDLQLLCNIKESIIAIAHLLGDVDFFVVTDEGELSVYNCIQSGLFAPHKLVIKHGHLFIANRSSQYGIFNIRTRTSVYFGATVAPVVDLCIASESDTNIAFCLLTENSRVIVITPPITFLQRSVCPSGVQLKDLLRATIHTLIFGRSEECTPTSLAITYQNSLITVFITTAGGHIYMRRVGVTHKIDTDGNLSTFKLDSDALSFIHVTRSVNPESEAHCSQLVKDALSQPRGSAEKVEAVRHLVEASACQTHSYVINENMVLCSSLTGMSGCEEPLNSVTVLSEPQKSDLYWISGVITSHNGLLIWFTLPLLWHDLG
ncbi:Hypothetical protein GLP15_621 [Giardia lamblia P15]|uniref:Uncharacterized protein n=1 Tax=Giardia intestinalis (strain P15) TaxID=658858 RepID=E1F588_GIAIA|nr:Hypothetical protein GLP15_621 [Giardia lamblia P15]